MHRNVLYYNFSGSHRVARLQQQQPTEGLYSCYSCGQAFDRKSEYKSHMLVCKRDLAVVGISGGGVEVARLVECPTCAKLFRSQEGLAVHLAKDHEVGKTLVDGTGICIRRT